MSIRSTDHKVFAVFVAVSALTVPACVWIGASAMESRTFNKLTGAETTTLDAMFSRLRVTGDAQ